MNQNSKGKKVALLAYITFIGLLVAFYMNREERNEFATWHIKNMFGLLLLLFTAMALQAYEIGFYVYWLSVLLWGFCFLMAVTNKKQGIPVLSEKFQQWFTFLD